MDAPLTDLALEKLTNVLGPDRASAVLRGILAEAGLPHISTPQDLMVFAETLQRRTGVEGAVGSILGFQALLRGASRRDPVRS